MAKKASSQECKKFIAEIAPIIQSEAKARGYLVCSPVIAQACVESGYGLSKLSKNYNNFFGLKCGSAWKGKSVNLKTDEEYTVGTLTSIRDNFRVYNNMADGVKGYYDFISTKRYSNLKSASTPLMYLERIKADGYATSSRYVSTNMDCINRWDLTKWDNYIKEQTNTTMISPASMPTLRMGDRGDWVTIAQGRLVVNGFKIAVDGIFGEKTKQAVMAFQKEKGLTIDGIIGRNTWSKLY